MDTEVIVVGMGAMGSAALWRLAARGIGVVGFDQFAPPHDRGSSHGESRIIRTAYFEDPRYVPLLRHAFTLWREIESECEAALLTETGALMIGPRDSTLISGTLASARAHGLEHEVLDAGEMGRRYPQHRLGGDDVAVYEELAGFLRPEDAIAAMLGQAERLGASVRRATRVEELDAGRDRVRVRTAGGEIYEARHAIVAVGAWLGSFLPQWNLPLRVERQVLGWFPVHDPTLYDPRRCPVYIRELAGHHHRYGFPSLDGASVKIAVHHEGETASPDTIDRAVRAQDIAPLQDYVRACLAGVAPSPVRAQVCMYTNAPDEHFIIGAPPAMHAVTVLSPCSGHGFKFAPVIGDIAADLAVEGRTGYPIALFSPHRFDQAPSLL